MVLVYILIAIYLLIGFIYAVNVLINGRDPWYVFPINMLGGPLVIIQIYRKTKKEEKMPYLGS